MATPENFAGHQHLYRVSATPPPMGISLPTPSCLTCLSSFADYPRMTAAAVEKAEGSWDAGSVEENSFSDSFSDSTGEGTGSDNKLESCQYFSAIFAPNNNEYALIECLGPGNIIFTTSCANMTLKFVMQTFQQVGFIKCQSI